LAVPQPLGRRATSLVSRMGPFEGRELRAGDELPVGGGAVGSALPHPTSAIALPAGGARVRVLMGPHDDRFGEDAVTLLLASRFTIASDSNRMGYRLRGPLLNCLSGTVVLSDATPMGSIQVT